jgi:hypothetical protein
MSIPIEQAAAPGHSVWIDALARNTTATARATPRRASDSQPRALGRSLASRQSRRFGSVRSIGAPTASRPGAMEATEDTHPVHSRFRVNLSASPAPAQIRASSIRRGSRMANGRPGCRPLRPIRAITASGRAHLISTPPSWDRRPGRLVSKPETTEPARGGRRRELPGPRSEREGGAAVSADEDKAVVRRWIGHSMTATRRQPSTRRPGRSSGRARRRQRGPGGSRRVGHVAGRAGVGFSLTGHPTAGMTDARAGRAPAA